MATPEDAFLPRKNLHVHPIVKCTGGPLIHNLVRMIIIMAFTRAKKRGQLGNLPHFCPSQFFLKYLIS